MYEIIQRIKYKIKKYRIILFHDIEIQSEPYHEFNFNKQPTRFATLNTSEPLTPHARKIIIYSPTSSRMSLCGKNIHCVAKK